MKSIVSSVRTESSKIPRICSRLHWEKMYEDTNIPDGSVETPFGFVLVLGYEDGFRLDMAYKGRLYLRTVDVRKMPSLGYIATLARRFAEEIADANEE